MLQKYIHDPYCSLNTTKSCHVQASLTVIGCCLIYDFKFMSTDRSIPKVIVHKARTNLEVNIIKLLESLKGNKHIIKILIKM